MLAGFPHQLSHFIVRQKGRRTAAPMQLDHLVLAIATFQRRSLNIQFLGQILQVLCTAPVILGNDLVASAVVANSVAERDVEV